MISISIHVCSTGVAQHHLLPRRPGGGGQGQPLGLELVQQAVDVGQGLPLEGGPGEIGLLEMLDLPLDGDDGGQVPQGDGHPVHLRHLGQVGVRVGEQGLHLL